MNLKLEQGLRRHFYWHRLTLRMEGVAVAFALVGVALATKRLHGARSRSQKSDTGAQKGE